MPLIDPCLLVVSNLPGVALGVDGLPSSSGEIELSSKVMGWLQMWLSNVACDLPILLAWHLFDPGAGEVVLYHGLFFQHNG